MKPYNPSDMKTIFLDIMMDGRFYRQLAYKYCPLWPLDGNDIEACILKAFPWLRNKKYTIAFSEQEV